MTDWSVPAIMRIWIRNGGDPAAVINACAVCWAESGGNDRAIGPAGDYGLWQINRMNFASQGLNAVTALDPDRNARVAIRMSSNGTNWGPWCTCYTDPGPMCGRLRLSGPQMDSPAANELGFIRDELAGIVANDPIVLPSGPEDELNAAWGYFQDFIGNWGNSLQQQLTTINNATRRL